MDKFNIKCIEFTCEPIDESPLESAIAKAAETATKQTVNAFQVLMAGGRAYPDFKTSKLSILSILCQEWKRVISMNAGTFAKYES